MIYKWEIEVEVSLKEEISKYQVDYVKVEIEGYLNTALSKIEGSFREALISIKPL